MVDTLYLILYDAISPEPGERELEAAGGTPPAGLVRTAAHWMDMLSR